MRAPAGAHVIDGSGRYLMPALWDMPVVGHVTFAAGIQGALAARQKSIEHLRGYIEELVPADAPIQPGIDMRSRTLAWEYADLSRIPELVRALAAAAGPAMLLHASVTTPQ